MKIEPKDPEIKGYITKEYYDRIKRNAKSVGLEVVTRWRKNLRVIRLKDIILDEPTNIEKYP